MKKLALLLVALTTLSACDPGIRPAEWVTDKSKQQSLFLKCMSILPAGPETTKYNDWDEVVSECNRISFYQAKYCVARCPAGAQTQPYITPNQ